MRSVYKTYNSRPPCAILNRGAVVFGTRSPFRKFDLWWANVNGQWLGYNLWFGIPDQNLESVVYGHPHWCMVPGSRAPESDYEYAE